MNDDLAAAAADLERLAVEAAELADVAASSGSGLVPVGSNLPAQALKSQMAEVRAAAVKKSVELREAQAVMKRRLDAEMEKAREVLGPLELLVKKLEEGIWSVNLYLGRDEEIVTLTQGESAPETTPIVLRQMVLNMDEESAIAAEHGGIDARTIGQFDDWLLADPAHLEQVFPESKGVVVLRPRRSNKEYGDRYTNAQMAEANAQSYWLIRNGENLYRITTDLNVGDRLIPARDEFTDFFTTTEYVDGKRVKVPLDPGSSSWLRAEEAAGDRQRHFLRIGLVLQGLVDRTTVLHPLPAPTISFLQPLSYDAGHIVIVSDDDLAIGTGREPFREWQRRLCAELRPGMRIIGAFDTGGFRYYQSGEDADRRIAPPGASRPDSLVIHYLEGRRDDGLYFLYERTDKRHGYEHGDYGRWGAWDYQKRASCVIYPDDPFILPFDLVNVEEMEIYLGARLDRHEYANLFPLLKATIAAKEAEAELEAPFRSLLAGELTKTFDMKVPDAYEVVPELVDWWKLSNRWHRPLVSDDEGTQAKALRMIVKEYKARTLTEAAASKRDEPTRDMILREHPDAVLVARRRDGTYIAYTPTDDRDVYVNQFTWTKTGRAQTPAPWSKPSLRWRDWAILHTTKRWEGWKLLADTNRLLTGPEADGLLERVLSETDVWQRESTADARVAAVAYNDSARDFYLYLDDLAEPNTDRPLTNNKSNDAITKVTVRWYRERSGLRLSRYGSRSESMGDLYRRRSASSPPWERGYNEQLVWTDETVIFNLARRHKAHLELHAEHTALAETAARALSSVLDAWKADALAMHYARFLDDFMDPDLWEGHFKTLRIELPDKAREALDERIDRVVEEGYDIDGWTVDELDGQFHRLVPDPDKAVNHRSMGGDWWRPATPLPDEFRHRVISTTQPDDD